MEEEEEEEEDDSSSNDDDDEEEEEEESDIDLSSSCVEPRMRLCGSSLQKSSRVRL